jgi:UV DNA damage repair endonuclease
MIKYIRTNLQAGPDAPEYTAPFNGTHHHVFADSQKSYGYNSMIKVAYNLIETWNRQQPEHWSYRIAQEESK